MTMPTMPATAVIAGRTAPSASPSGVDVPAGCPASSTRPGGLPGAAADADPGRAFSRRARPGARRRRLIDSHRRAHEPDQGLTFSKCALHYWHVNINNRKADGIVTHDVIATCPVCQSELSVTRLRCGACGTTIEGEFSVGRFGRLSREQQAVLESFLRSRGNLREMERELGISYPTVRARVESLVRALGFGPREAEPTETGDGEPPGAASVDDIAERRREVLERLARRELSAEDAAVAIRAIGRTRR